MINNLKQLNVKVKEGIVEAKDIAPCQCIVDNINVARWVFQIDFKSKSIGMYVTDKKGRLICYDDEFRHPVKEFKLVDNLAVIKDNVVILQW